MKQYCQLASDGNDGPITGLLASARGQVQTPEVAADIATSLETFLAAQRQDVSQGRELPDTVDLDQRLCLWIFRLRKSFDGAIVDQFPQVTLDPVFSGGKTDQNIKSNIFSLAATNRDLKTMVEEQRFRSDLYYRLNVFPIRVPSLRERKEDIPLLVRHFVKEFSRRNQRVIDTIPSETMQALICYHWPGNIRELQNVIERAVIISRGPVLNVALADLTPDGSSPPVHMVTSTKSASHESLQEMLDETE
ncbi:sigma 54-interacting transcriptional regulator [Edaphobacter aggregans]|uniref:sigma 54-interacting transcriptional regulator n=1 Tax=Edaphobacter aggregans TaxID=570835 RepID=UPI0005531C8C|nr:sigma 54-interacting transcriptional regulator [Edaphobacter aggregans]